MDDRVRVSYAYTTTDANGEYNLISAPETVTSTPFSATLRYFSQGTDGGLYQVERPVMDFAWPAPLELPDIAIDRIRILAPRGVDHIPCRTTYQWDIPASLSSETLTVEFEVGIRILHGGWSWPYLSRDVTGLSRATIAVPCGSGANDFKPDEWYDWDIKASSSDGLVRIAYGGSVRFLGP